MELEVLLLFEQASGDGKAAGPGTTYWEVMAQGMIQFRTQVYK